MNLAEIYSSTSNIPLDVPYLYESFYPIDTDKYIVIHPSSGNPCKNYDYWQEVVDYLVEGYPQYKIIQLGGGEDIPLNHCINLNGKTNIHQTAYIIKRARLLIGNDSALAHMAGALNVPVVAVYGPTSSKNHGPHWKTENTVLIDSHRDGKNPSFHFNESPKTINMIMPEEIIAGVSRIIGECTLSIFESVYFGNRYNDKIVEVVPDALVPQDFIPNAVLNIRADYNPNLNHIYGQIQIRKCSIYTDVPLDVNILMRFKENVVSIIYEVTHNDEPRFVADLISAAIPVVLVTKLDDEVLNKKKLSYLDLAPINKVVIPDKSKIEKADLVTEKSLFKTKKILLSNGKGYASNAHRLFDLPLSNINKIVAPVLDYPKFYEELDFFYIFNQKELTKVQNII